MHQNAFSNRIKYMSKNIEKLFVYLETFEPSIDLYEKIVKKIDLRRKITSRRRFFVFSILFALSLFAIIPSVKMLINDFSSSGFLQFLSLLFTDSTTILNYWKSFALILLESLPIMSTVIFFGAVFVMLESIRFLSKDIKFVFSHNN
jgi:hypothetical protein